MRLFRKLYRLLESTYYSQTARFTKGWRIHHSRKLGLRLLLNLDHYIDYLIFRYDVFEPHVIKALDHILRNRKVEAFIDVGSNIGQMSLYVARHFPEVRVISYEPIPANYAQQKASMLLNDLHYEVHHTAVSNKREEIKLYQPKRQKGQDLGKHNSGMPSIHLDAFRDEQNWVNVGAVPLAEELHRLGLHRVEGYLLLKIDVEGAELAVLEGLKPFFAHSSGIIILIELLFEQNNALSCKAAELLLTNGFTLMGIDLEPLSGVEAIDWRQTDFIFVREAEKLG